MKAMVRRRCSIGSHSATHMPRKCLAASRAAHRGGDISMHTDGVTRGMSAGSTESFPCGMRLHGSWDSCLYSPSGRFPTLGVSRPIAVSYLVLRNGNLHISDEIIRGRSEPDFFFLLFLFFSSDGLPLPCLLVCKMITYGCHSVDSSASACMSPHDHCKIAHKVHDCMLTLVALPCQNTQRAKSNGGPSAM